MIHFKRIAISLKRPYNDISDSSPTHETHRIQQYPKSNSLLLSKLNDWKKEVDEIIDGNLDISFSDFESLPQFTVGTLTARNCNHLNSIGHITADSLTIENCERLTSIGHITANSLTIKNCKTLQTIGTLDVKEYTISNSQKCASLNQPTCINNSLFTFY